MAQSASSQQAEHGAYGRPIHLCAVFTASNAGKTIAKSDSTPVQI